MKNKGDYILIVAIGVMLACIITFVPRTPSPVDVAPFSTSTIAVPQFLSEPDPIMTPGVPNPNITQADIQQNICNPKWSTSSIRPPTSYTSPLKLKQMVVYGDVVSDPNATCIPHSDNPKCYEEDHCISLEIGGSPTDPKNLFPQPYNPVPGARQKDLLENYAHKQVCSGAWTLGQAQKIVCSPTWVDVARTYGLIK